VILTHIFLFKKLNEKIYITCTYNFRFGLATRKPKGVWPVNETSCIHYTLQVKNVYLVASIGVHVLRLCKSDDAWVKTRQNHYQENSGMRDANMVPHRSRKSH
jgi:hypothetical protein